MRISFLLRRIFYTITDVWGAIVDGNHTKCAATTPIKAIAVATGFKNSAVGEATFEIDFSRAEGPDITMPKPHVSGRYATLSTGTSGATILFTQDGTAPAYSGTPATFVPTGTTTVYTGPFQLTTNDSGSTDHTVRAIAIAEGYKDSLESFTVFTILPGRIVTNSNKTGGGSLYAAVAGANDGPDEGSSACAQGRREGEGAGPVCRRGRAAAWLTVGPYGGRLLYLKGAAPNQYIVGNGGDAF